MVASAPEGNAMAATKKIRIGIKDIRELGEGWTLWDTRVSGFCARRRKSAAVFYALKYRTGEGRQRWLTIGRHGAPWTPDTARDEAQRILAEVVQGKDPAAQKLAKRRAATVAELCEEYLMAAAQGRLLTRRGGNKKESTLATDRSRIEAHIKPLLGDRKVPEVTRQDIEKFMHDVAGGSTKRRCRLDQAARFVECEGWPRCGDANGRASWSDFHLCHAERTPCR